MKDDLDLPLITASNALLLLGALAWTEETLTSRGSDLIDALTSYWIERQGQSDEQVALLISPILSVCSPVLIVFP